MRKVNKDFQNPPSILLSAGCLSQIKQAVETQDGEKYTTSYYKHEEVVNILKRLYKEKCAYCESEISFAATLQVEHYRPKAALDSDKDTDVHHKGYYWLGNEWSNLLLSCPKCNQKGAKGNCFPIKGVRHFADSPFDADGNFDRTNMLIGTNHLQKEEPLLLNPELFEENDNPENHFTFDRFGYITGKTIQGSITIEVCKLRRERLCLQRLKKLNNLLKEFNVIIEGLKRGKLNDDAVIYLLNIAFEKVKKSQEDTEPYTLWAKHFYNHFEECFISRLDIEYKDAITMAFEQFKLGKL